MDTLADAVMGSTSSKSQTTPAASVPPTAVAEANAAANAIVSADANQPEESTKLEDLIQSGRYKVASPETINMLKQMQGPRQTNIMYPDSEVKDLKQYITEQEGLDIGSQRRKALAQQWRFYLSCEPIQRGLDAGIIFGCAAAGFMAWKNPKKRVPSVIGLTWLGGFCAGVISVPLMVVAAEAYNSQRIRKMEKEMFSRQREEFYKKD